MLNTKKVNSERENPGAEALGFVRPHQREGARGLEAAAVLEVVGEHASSHTPEGRPPTPGLWPPFACWASRCHPPKPLQSSAPLSSLPGHQHPICCPLPASAFWTPPPRARQPLKHARTSNLPHTSTPQYPQGHLGFPDPQAHGHTQGSPRHTQGRSAALGLWPHPSPPSQAAPTCRALVSLGPAAEDQQGLGPVTARVPTGPSWP